MSIFIAEKEIKNPFINGKQVNTAFMNGIKVYSNAPPPTPGLYIAEGERSAYNRCFIYENNNGQKGNLVDTIARNNWDILAAQNDWNTFAQYAPEIEIALDDVCNGWTAGIGVPLNFAKLKTVGNAFLGGCSEFNQEILFPMLTTAGNSLLSGCLSFNQDISFPMLTTIGFSFMNGCLSLGINNSNIKISLGKQLLLDNIHQNWFDSSSANLNDKINIEFQGLQTISTLPSKFCRYRGPTLTEHSPVNLYIKDGSANVDVAHKTWAGHIFGNITLI